MATSHYSILILEDSPENRSIYRKYLNQDLLATYNVIEAESGIAAWAQLRQNQPDLILLNEQLPDIGGLEFLQQLREQFDDSQIPAIILADLANEAIASGATQYLASEFLEKSQLTSAKLCQTLHFTLEKTHLKQQLKVQAQQQQFLARTLQRIHQCLQLEELLTTTVNELREFLQVDRVLLCQLNASIKDTVISDSILPQSQSGLNNQIQDICWQEHQRIANTNSDIWAIPDIQAAELTACHLELLEKFHVKAHLVVPILLKYESNGDFSPVLWGLLIVHHCRATRQWQTHELDLLTQLSVHLAVAIQQAQMYENVQNLNSVGLIPEEREMNEKKRLEKERQEALAALKASEAELRGLFNAMVDVILVVDKQGRYLKIAPTGADKLYLPPEELIGKTAHEILPHHLAEQFVSLIGETLATQATKECEYSLHIGNQDLWFHAKVSPISAETVIWAARDITAAKRHEIIQKNAEQALQENQILLRVIMDSLPMSIFWKDQNYRYLGCNRQFLIDAGLTSTAEIFGKTDFEMVWQEQAPIYQADDRLVMESRQPKFNIEEPITKSGNLHRWLRTNKVPLHRPDGEIIGILGSYEDITERKAIEQALQESERRYATLAASAPVGIFRTDAQGNCLYVNHVWCENTGLTPQQAAGQGWAVALHPEDRDIVAAQWHHLIQTEETFSLEYRFLRPDGLENWVFGQAVPEKNPDGTVIGYIGTITNINRSKKAEAALRHSQNLYRTLVDNFPNGAFVLYDRDLRYVLVGGLELARAGFNKSDMEGKTVWEIFPPETCEIIAPMLYKALAGETVIAEVPYQESLYLTHYIPVRDEQGNVIAGILMTQNITERKQAENALRDSEEKFRQFAENSHQVMLLRQIDSGELLYVNPIYEEVWGRSCDSLLASPNSWQDALHPDDVPRIEATYQATAGQGFFSEEYRIIRPDGSIRWIWGRCFPIQDRTGKIYRIGAIAEDITKRKQTEQERDRLLQILALQNQTLEQEVARRTAELQQSENRFRNLVETSSDWVWEVNESGVYTYVSPQIINILGYYPEEVLGKTPFDLMPPQEAERVLNEFMKFVSVQAPFQCLENTNCHKDGRLIILETSAVPIFDADGQFRGYRGMDRDITARKRSQAQLQEAEIQLRNLSDRLKLAVTSAKIGIWDWDLLNDSILWDERMYELFGVSPENFDISQGAEAKLEQLFHPDDTVALKTTIQQVIAGDGELETEVRIILADGKIRTLKAYGLVQRDSQGQIQRLIGIAYDISERKLAEIQLQQTNQQLATSNAELARATRLKDEFLATMSHELRTPLNAILGLSEALQEEVFGVINDKQRRSLQTIERSGKHLLELINDILDLSKIEAGQLELHYTQIAISPLCQASLTFIKQQALQKRIQLEVNIQPHLPKLMVDERRIRQVLINLLNNAVKFTPEGGRITLEVTHQKLAQAAEMTSAQNFIRIAVIDTGIGIAPKNLNKLFQPFIQIDSALNRQYNGTGLGLVLVKRLVEIHGGKVGVSSEPGIGSCFSVDLPCGNISEVADSVQSLSSELNSTLIATAKDSPLILLAEDNEANILTFSGYLEAVGYRLILAKTGQEAIALSKSQSPNLILMDIQMPGVDGLEAIKQIRADSHCVNIPIIALTALAMPGDREQCLAGGANEYLCKPVKLQQLAALIQQLLDASN
ncbi:MULTISPECIES: PAS domain S-box protein [Calothrix]|uniref:histidine kinase n=2 Tax=Calothrix TaxID=1186 RepID=A0ABR8ANP5_9CYAN|nr:MULTISPECIES: PAS domain S-box protein [Calothrix]MBD2200843.1 PAS domain S-box protein [Calothrix parietina FACHB-288]MBD2229023.1 PAS domain S-box protein [Calothrix anomala FACHB-343]